MGEKGPSYKNDLIIAQISAFAKQNISASIDARVDFLYQSLEKFRSRFETVFTNEPLKAQELWKSISDIQTKLYERLNESFELDSLLGRDSFEQQWFDPYLPLIEQSEAGTVQPYDGTFWHLRSSRSLSEKIWKILHYFLHPLKYIRARGHLPRLLKTPVRKFDPYGFNEFFVLFPLLEFQWREQYQLLLFYSGFLVQFQTATEKFKDSILQSSEMISPENYWPNLHDLNSGAYIGEFARDLDQMKLTVQTYGQDAQTRLSVFLEELSASTGDLWRKAGTLPVPARKFSRNRRKRYRIKKTGQLQRFRDAWINHLESVKDEWQKDLELGILQFKIAALHHETGNLVRQKSEGKIVPALEELKQKLKEERQSLTALQAAPGKTFHEELLVFSRNLQRGLKQKQLVAAIDALSNARLSRTFRGFISRVADLVENLSEQHVIIKAYNINKLIPNTSLDEVNLKEIAQEEIVRRSERANEEQIAQLAVDLDAITRTVTTIEQVIAFNFDSAIELVRRDPSPEQSEIAVKLAVEGIDRTIALLDDAQIRFNEAITDGMHRIDIIAFELEQGVQKLSDNERILELKLRHARARTQEKVRRWRKDTFQLIIKFVPDILHYLRNYFRQLSSGYRKVQKISGLSSLKADERMDISAFLHAEELKLSRLPFIYQRLFTMLPLDDDRFFFGRSLEMEKIGAHFEAFRNGQVQITAVIGEKGGGKTTLLNFARKSIFKGYPIGRAAVPYTIYDINEFCGFLTQQLQLSCEASMEAIEQFLREGSQRILILEDIHNLFLRTIDGFRVIEALLKLISATQEKVYWIVSSGQYGWRFLEYFIGISDFFTDVVELDNLDREEVEQLIMSRHDMSGFRLEFIANPEISATRAYKKLKHPDEQQRFVRNRLFEHLSEVSGGNVKTSLTHWISNIEFSKPDEPIRAMDQIEIDRSFIYQISSEDLYQLAAFIQHEFLKAEEFALIFDSDQSLAKFKLDRMARKGYLRIEQGNYFIPAMLYHPIVYILKSRNIIY